MQAVCLHWTVTTYLASIKRGLPALLDSISRIWEDPEMDASRMGLSDRYSKSFTVFPSEGPVASLAKEGRTTD
jgi:hypothetical protein